jgi:Ca-activated chloride channel homolog
MEERLMKRLMRYTALRLLVVGTALALLPWAMAAADAPVTEGALQALDKEGQPMGMCPLEHTDVAVDISGFIARVTLTQRFGNPYTTPIEAIYTFPMSDRAAVDSMTMTIGDRVIKGVIKERGEARRIYEAARNAGKAASLLDQERPNIFTQTVANILPGDTVNITISYVEYLQYEAGEYEFSFPMVVGPRYIPGAPATPPPDAIQPDVSPGLRPGPMSTDQVPDASRITPPVTPKGTRAGHDIDLVVRLDAGVAIQNVKSELHEVEVEQPGDSQAVVRLKDKKTIPNRDFVLRYAVAGPAIADAVLTHAGERGGFFTLILQPPDRVEAAQVTPKEMMFVIDCSGSMRGFPIEKAKDTMRMAIEGMNPDDTFNLVTFAGGVGYCFDRPVPNTPANQRKALDYLSNLQGSGGTEMMKAIHAALGDQNDPERLRVVCFMTDGFIGNDMAILDAIQKNAGTARVFSFGIGNSVNRFLIEGMARTGRGASEVVTLESDGDAASKRFHERIQSPLLTDITVDFGGLAVEDIYPDVAAIPDLFAARPLVLKGRYSAPGEGFITVRGNTAAGPFERRVAVTLPGDEPAHDVLAPLWARERIAWLMDQNWLGAQQGKPDADIKGAVTELGLTYSLVTQYTSFVAVEERVITEGGKPKTVQVPVEMPDGVSYEGVFGEEEERMMAGAALGSVRGARMAQAPRAAARGRVLEKRSAADSAVRQSPARPQAVPEMARPLTEQNDKDEAKQEGHSKLDRALWGLQAKLTNGNYTQGRVKVRDGWVEVFVHMTGLTDDTLAQLKKLGVRIVTEVHSKKLVVAKIRVADLERIAALNFVNRIEPPKY